MKKLCVLLMAVLFLLPLNINVCALESVSQNLHFDSPSAVCADDRYVYVGDNTDNGGILYVFGEAETKSVSFDEQINFVRKAGDKVYVGLENSISAVNVSDMTQIKITAQNLSAFDVNDSYIFASLGKVVYRKELFLIQDGVNVSDFDEVTPSSGNNEIIDIAAGNGNVFCYLLKTQSGVVVYKSENGVFSNYEAESAFSLELENGIIYEASPNKISQNGTTAVEFDFENGAFCLNGDEMYVCDTAGLKVYFYKKIDGNLQKQQLVLGTNVKDFSTDYDKIDGDDDLDVRKITSRTFLYAADENGWYGYLNENEYVFVLSEIANENFLYVLYVNGEGNPCFGFVEKSKTQTQSFELLNADKVTINSNENFFTLPVNSNEYKVRDAGGQIVSLSNTTPVRLITNIKGFDGGVWSFVRIDDTYGFILSGKLKDPPVVLPTYEMFVANPPIGSSLSVYADADLSSEIISRIKSGQTVNVYEQNEKWSKIRLSIDGKDVYGYVETKYLIKGGMTDTVALGLAIGIILLLCVGFALVWRYRKKRRQ